MLIVGKDISIVKKNTEETHVYGYVAAPECRIKSSFNYC